MAVDAVHASKEKTSPCGESEKVSPSGSGEDAGQNVSCGPFGWSVDEEGTLWGRGLKLGGWPGCGMYEALPSSSICCLPELVRAEEDSGCEGMRSTASSTDYKRGAVNSCLLRIPCLHSQTNPPLHAWPGGAEYLTGGLKGKCLKIT